MELRDRLKEFEDAVNKGFGYFLMILIAVLSSTGFVTGMLSLGFWFIENTGEFPMILILIWKIVDVLFIAGAMFIGLIFYIWILKKAAPSIEKWAEERKSKREAWVLKQHGILAKMIAKEIKASGKRGK